MTDERLAGWIRERRARVDDELARLTGAWRVDVPDRLAEAMAYSLLGGGKRLRPVLCLGAFEACGGGDAAAALDLALALELVHTYSLIHDDLPAMDDDDLRRGRPTCHKVYGEATAILAGDALLTEAFGLVAREPQPVRVRLAATLARAAGAAGMVGGQALDLAMEGRLSTGAPLPALEEIEGIHRRKTAALIAAACEGGALAAGVPARRVESLRIYGVSLGLAFQIADDVLDVVGDPQEMGKSGRGDEDKGKPTVPALLGIEDARRLARSFQDQAVSAIADLGEDAWPLRALAGYVVERSS